MSVTPTVSVVIPCYNAERFLAEALESVLGQTLVPDEVVVVDDGSTDRSRDVAGAYRDRVRLVCQANGGVAAARRRGGAEVSGDLVASCDADDIWRPEKLERQVAALLAQPELDAIGCLVDEFWTPPMDRAELGGPPLREGLRGVLASAMLVRRAIDEALAAHETNADTAEGVDWFAEALDVGMRWEVLDEVLVLRRVHDANTSRALINDDGRAYLLSVRAHLARRRERQ